MDNLIQHLQVTSQSRFDLRGNPHAATQYSYFVLTHGPFVDTFEQDADTPEAVKSAMQARIDKLRAVGAIPSGY
jgi:hypothetical protein